MSADDHGSRSTYMHHGCRCNDCRAATAAYEFRRRARLAREVAGGLYDVEHGSHSTYVNYLCRCGPCTAASAEYHRKRRASA